MKNNELQSSNLGDCEARMCTPDVHQYTSISVTKFARGGTEKHRMDQYLGLLH